MARQTAPIDMALRAESRIVAAAGRGLQPSLCLGGAENMFTTEERCHEPHRALEQRDDAKHDVRHRARRDLLRARSQF